MAGKIKLQGERKEIPERVRLLNDLLLARIFQALSLPLRPGSANKNN
jgi:hypothetical protein